MMHQVKPSRGRLRGGWDVLLWVAMGTLLYPLAVPGNGMAANIVVNSLEDTVVSGDGVCTLREAVLNAERDTNAGSTDCTAGSGADTITFSLSGTVAVPSVLTLTSAGSLTIDGGNNITISGGVISVESNGILTLKNLTFANGFGISNAGITTVSHSTVHNHLGNISNSGVMRISDSTVSDNKFLVSGGSPTQGIILNRGILTISTSTISGNHVASTTSHPQSRRPGGAIYNTPEGFLTISNSTISGNFSGGDEGDEYPVPFADIWNEGTFAINSSTVSDNPGIFNSGTVKLHASLITNGCATSAPIFGEPVTILPVTSLGYNLDRLGTCGLTGPGDQSNLDPRLDPAGLKDNGGPTKSIALCTGSGTPAGCTGKSPAIDAVSLAQCTGAGGQPLGLDQRNSFRPADGDRNGTVLCDIGAFEATSSPLTTLNSLVTFTPLSATYYASRDTAGCPTGYVGKFQFTADLTNKPGSPPLSHLVAEVATLTKGNLVLDADGGLGGDGATITFGTSGQYADGVLRAKEHVALPVTLCLKTFSPFTFFVDVLGTR